MGGSDTPWAKGPANSCTRASRNPWDKVPPHGRCTQSIKVNPSKLRDLGHRCIVADFSDNSFVCICQLCAVHTTGARLAKLGEPCRGKPPRGTQHGAGSARVSILRGMGSRLSCLRFDHANDFFSCGESPTPQGCVGAAVPSW